MIEAFAITSGSDVIVALVAGGGTVLFFVGWSIWWKRTYVRPGEDVREARNRYRREYQNSRSPAVRSAQRRSNRYALLMSGLAIIALLFAAATKPHWAGIDHLTAVDLVTGLLTLSALIFSVLYAVEVVRVAIGVRRERKHPTSNQS
jgi:threonine/homoserine/homoserine lactone efflux protein